jgi:hypothetical protein
VHLHQDRAKARLCRVHCRFFGFDSVLVLPLFCELHDQDRVLGRQSEEHHEPDLGQYIKLTLDRDSPYLVIQPALGEGKAVFGAYAISA